MAELDRQIKRGTERLLKSPEDITDLLAPQLSGWRKERDRLAAETATHTREAAPQNIEAEAEAAVDRLWTLANDLQGADPARLREVIRRMVGRIELWFDHVPHGKRVECPLSKGTIELQPSEIFFGQVSRGDRIEPATSWSRSLNGRLPKSSKKLGFPVILRSRRLFASDFEQLQNLSEKHGIVG